MSFLYAGCHETEKCSDGADKKRYQAEKGCDSVGKKTFTAPLCRLPVEYAYRHNLAVKWLFAENGNSLFLTNGSSCI